MKQETEIHLPPQSRRRAWAVEVEGRYGDVGLGWASMSELGDKLRLAIAVFEDGKAIWRTLGELLAAGVSCDQMGVVGSSLVLEELSAPCGGRSDVACAASRLSKALQPVVDARIKDGVLASRELLDLWRQGVEVPALWSRTNGEPMLNAELVQWVAQGAAVLAVRSWTPAQLWVATRVLLERSVSPVQTIEVSLPGL